MGLAGAPEATTLTELIVPRRGSRTGAKALQPRRAPVERPRNRRIDPLRTLVRMSARAKSCFLATLFVALLLLAARAGAQTFYLGGPPPPPAMADTTLTISVHPLKPGVFAAKVRYGWVGWIEQTDGIVLIDAGPDEYAASALADSIRAYSGAKPIRTIVLTHAHEDHILGARHFLAKGARLVAHANVAAAIDSALGRSAGATIRVKGKYDLGSGKGPRAAQVVALGPAHTKGDLVVYLPKERVLFAGDLVSYKAVPWMLDPGMSVPGWKASLDSLMTARFAADSLVPGHGEIGPSVTASGWAKRYLIDSWEKARVVAGWGSPPTNIKEWGYLGAYEGLEFYEETHFMNLRRLINEVKGIKTPGRPRARAVKR